MTNTFDIRSDLPMPPRKAYRMRIDFPFAEMKVGQCLIVKWGSRTNVRKKIGEFCRDHPGFRFEMRTLEEKKTVGYWCTARPDAPSTSPVTPIRRIEPDPEPSAPSNTVNKLREAARLTKPGTRTVVRK